MECPKCGFAQPEGAECIACGIIFAKYWAVHGPPSGAESSAPEEPPPEPQTTAPAPSVEPVPASTPTYDELLAQTMATEAASRVETNEPVAAYDLAAEDVESAPEPTSVSDEVGSDAEAPAPQPVAPTARGPAPSHRVFRSDTRAEVTIGRSTMFIRALAGVACLGIAVLMFANGKGLLSVWPYVIMVFYGGAAIWGLASLSQKVSIQQFAVEMAVLVAVTLGLRVAAPEMFTVESPTQGVVPKITKPYLPKTPLGRFTKRVLTYIESGRQIIDAHDVVPEPRWKTWTRDASFEEIKATYTLLSTDERARVWDVWKRVAEVGPMLTDMVARYAKAEGDGVRLTASGSERKTVMAELERADLSAGQLRARLLIYPTVEGDY